MKTGLIMHSHKMATLVSLHRLSKVGSFFLFVNINVKWTKLYHTQPIVLRQNGVYESTDRELEINTF